jgi:hypothetical protein
MQTVLIVVLTVLATLATLAILAGFGLRWWVRRRILAAIAAGQSPETAIAPSIHFEPIDGETRWQQASTPGVFARFAALGYIGAGRFRSRRSPAWRSSSGRIPMAPRPPSTTMRPCRPSSTSCAWRRTRRRPTSRRRRSTTRRRRRPASSPSRTTPCRPKKPSISCAALRPTGALLRATAENVCALAAASYERQIAHILTMQSPTGEQMRAVGERVAAATGSEAPELDDETLRFAAEIQRHVRERALVELIVQSFLRTNPFSAEEWERMRDHVVVIHDR